MPRALTPPAPVRTRHFRGRWHDRGMGIPPFIRRPPPTKPSPVDEGIRVRGKRDTGRLRKSWLVRGIVGVLGVIVAVAVEEVLVSANKPSFAVGLLTVVALVGVPFTALGVIWATQTALA